MKSLTAISSFFFLSLSVYAVKVPLKGQIITATDTQNVVFNVPMQYGEIPNYEMLQKKITYTNASKEKITVRPDQATEIRFTYKSEVIRMLSRKTTFGTLGMETSIFLKLEHDGVLKLFTYYDTQRSGGGGMYGAGMGSPMGAPVMMSRSIERSVFQKRNEALMKPDMLTFRSDLKKYFADCPDLVSRIEHKDFKKDDVDLMVYFYNDFCGK